MNRYSQVLYLQFIVYRKYQKKHHLEQTVLTLNLNQEILCFSRTAQRRHFCRFDDNLVQFTFFEDILRFLVTNVTFFVKVNKTGTSKVGAISKAQKAQKSFFEKKT